MDRSSLADAARTALAALQDPGQVLAVWERRLGPGGTSEALSVTVTAVVDGRSASAVASSAEPAALARAAKQAGLFARQMRALPAPALPAPGGRPVPGVSAEWAETDDVAVRVAAGPGVVADWSAGVALIAVASSAGIDVVEARSHGVVTASAEAADGRVAVASRCGVRVSNAGNDTGAGEEDGGADAEGRLGRGGRVDGNDRGGPLVGDEESGGGVADGRLAPMASAGAAAADVRALLGAGPAMHPLVAAVPALREAAPGVGPVGVVLGPEAVAVVLDALRSHLGVNLAFGDGPFAGRAGEQVAAACIDLRDDAGHPGTLPRAFDAEGVRREAVALIEAGVFVGGVRDSAAAARRKSAVRDGGAATGRDAAASWDDGAAHVSTGHSTRPLTLAPSPEHLVLGTGDAADVSTLCRELGDGLYLPTLAAGFEPGEDGGRIHAASGAALVRDGVPVGGLVDLHVEVEALAVLAAATQLTATRRLVALRGHCPGGIGAALVPALLVSDGVEVSHRGGER